MKTMTDKIAASQSAILSALRCSGHFIQADQKEGGIPDEFITDHKSKNEVQPT